MLKYLIRLKRNLEKLELLFDKEQSNIKNNLQDKIPSHFTKYLAKVKRWGELFFDKEQSEKLKHGFLQAIPFWSASLITGLIAVAYAELFDLASSASIYLFKNHIWTFSAFSIVCFIVSWWIVSKFAPYARGSGIPQIMAALEIERFKTSHKTNQLLSLRIVVIKIISSLALVLGGGAIGREGPTIQIGGAIFRTINKFLPKWWPSISKKNMIVSGSAAGIAAAFNTPLGGIVFAVEELSKTHFTYFRTPVFTAVIVAGLTAQGLAGPYLYLGYPSLKEISLYIFFAIILVSVVAGIVGTLSAKFMIYLLQRKSHLKLHRQHIIYLALVSLGITSLAFFIDDRVMGSGKELMTSVLFTDDKHVPWYLPFLRLTSSVFSFVSGGAGGIFAPALTTGASLGSWLSGLLSVSSSHSNLLILAGMVAFLTSLTKTPFTSAILVLEMTDRYNVIFYLMLAGMVANVISKAIDRYSFYDHLKNNYISELSEEHKAAS